jgi:4-carboxymuconolactone decarboxylase
MTDNTNINAREITADGRRDRLPPLGLEEMNDEQRELFDDFLAGPRGGVVGPYVALLRAPALTRLIEPLGSQLRFRGVLEPRMHFLTVCCVAAHTKNQFEWNVQAKAALNAGVSFSILHDIASGVRAQGLTNDEETVIEMTWQLLRYYQVSDDLYERATKILGEHGVVELITLVGFFVMICLVLNVAQTPAVVMDGIPALTTSS